MKLWLRKFVAMKHIVQMKGKVKRQTENEVGNKITDGKVPLHVWDKRQLGIYGAWREHQSTG
jgi:hypothetical protein